MALARLHAGISSESTLHSYALVVAAVIGYTWYHTKPESLGYGWIWIYLITVPWSTWMSPYLAAIINMALLYFLGVLVRYRPNRQ